MIWGKKGCRTVVAKSDKERSAGENSAAQKPVLIILVGKSLAAFAIVLAFRYSLHTALIQAVN